MRVFLIPVLIVCAGFVHADQDAPYAGQQQRDIKALSEQEMASYRNGEGMGMARAAELNHYPGPKHVLELSGELNLNEMQLDQTSALFEAMQSRASALGHELIAAEIELDRAFAQRTVNDNNLNQSLHRIGQIQAQLRYVHLQAHLEQRNILEPEQVEYYDKLRGYGSGNGDHSLHH